MLETVAIVSTVPIGCRDPGLYTLRGVQFSKRSKTREAVVISN